MKIITERSFNRFESWSGAKDTQEKIIKEGKSDLFESILDSLYPDGITDTELNDLLWFDSESVYEWLGITDDEEETEEEDDNE